MFRKEEKNCTRTPKVLPKYQNLNLQKGRLKNREPAALNAPAKHQKTSPPEVPLWQHGN